MNKLSGWIVPILALWMITASRAEESVGWWMGTWSAPSLSQPATPVIFALRPDGRATEQVGDYRGEGMWRVVNGSAQIQWASGWTGFLRQVGYKRFELATWKKGSPTDGPPDDVQRARRAN